MFRNTTIATACALIAGLGAHDALPHRSNSSSSKRIFAATLPAHAQPQIQTFTSLPAQPFDGEMWVAAQYAGERKSWFKRNGVQLRANEINVGETLSSTAVDVNVRSQPRGWDNVLFVLPVGQSVVVDAVRDVYVSNHPRRHHRSGYQTWLRLRADHVPSAMTAQAIEDRDIYYDDDGLIVHRDPDGKPNGGDTAQREGWYWLGVWIREHNSGLPPWTPRRKLNFDQVLKLLEPNGDGVFYRHPKLAPWNDPFNKEWGTSRDQLVPLIAAMGVWGKTDTLRRLWDALPEDAIGKHAFNGNYRNLLGQDGWNCAEIKKRSCGPTMDCSLRHDDRDCSLQVDARDCSLQQDTQDCSIYEDRRDCSQPHDERSCHTPLGNDPICEFQKAAQNKAYDAARAACEAAKAYQNALLAGKKGACEASKASQDLLYATQKATCEAERTAQNVVYSNQKLVCETTKSSQNVQYSGLKGLCETAKTGGKYSCEVYKAAAYQLCRISNIFSGDLIGPATVNLFRRAVGESPFVPEVNDVLSPTVVQGGTAGEVELLTNTHIRIGKSHDRDDVGDDLNHIVFLLMAKLRYPTFLSDSAAHEYAVQRDNSYGSYLGAYYSQYGSDFTDWKVRMDAGIASGWKPDVSAVYGAVRWYHRPDTGANPQLAKLYSVIVDTYIH